MRGMRSHMKQREGETMTRTEAAEHALKSIVLEREAVKHCTSLDNPEYVRLMRKSLGEKMLAESYVNRGK